LTLVLRASTLIAVQETSPEHELASRAHFMAAALAGAALAMLCIYIGLGFHDGFGDWDLHRVGRKFRRVLPWVLGLSLPFGALLRGFYAHLLSGKPTGPAILWSVVRAFVHFPLYGAVALISVMAGFAVLGLSALRFRLRGGAPPQAADDAVASWIAPPTWFIVLPFNLLGLPNEGDVELPETVSTRRLLRWLPAALAMLMLWTGAVSEDSGERIDPYWLAAAACYWLGDYLAVAWLVSPIMIARLRRRRA
jgi:hypothetical protein